MTAESSVALYKRQLRQLCEMWAQGLGESEEADQLRDEMELPERDLTDAQIQEMNALAAQWVEELEGSTEAEQ